MDLNDRDALCGAMFIAVGGAFALYAWAGLPMGEIFQMGPGFFPVVLGMVLIGLGVAIVAGSRGHDSGLHVAVSWRGVLLITGAVLFFGTFVRHLGFAPAAAVATFMAAIAPRDATLGSVLLLTAALTLFNVVVFVLLLRLPYPIVGPGLGG
jgi:hypothetical protein